jgi:broad specificity phosphatase PhoE
MALIYFVRHGKAAAGFGDHVDPGLDATGIEQAEATARLLAPAGPLSVYSSPLARARETSDPLVARRGVEASKESRVPENT